MALKEKVIRFFTWSKDALFFLGKPNEGKDRWKFRRQLVYGAYRLAVFMVLFGALAFFIYPEVATTLINGAVALLTIILSAYTASAVADDRMNKDKDIEP